MCEHDLDTIIHRLADTEAIRDLARRYAHCIWQKDSAGAARLFAEDGEMLFEGRPPIKGRQGLIESYGTLLASAMFHPFVHNHVIELHGDSATGTCYLDLRATHGGTSMVGSGYYDDRYLRAGGEWLFQSRKLTMCYLVPWRQGWAAQ